MKRYRYIIATFNHYFAVKGGYRAYKRFQDVLITEHPENTLELIEQLRQNDIHYTMVDKIIKNK